MTIDMNRVMQDHGLERAQSETRYVESAGHFYGTVSLRQGYRAGWRESVTWLLNRQAGWDTDLTDTERIQELRKGDGSIYHPIFNNGTDTPTIWVDCIACGRSVTDQTGRCHSCDLDLMERP